MEQKQQVINQISKEELEILCFDIIEEKKQLIQKDLNNQIKQQLLEIQKLREDAESSSKIKQSEDKNRRIIQ